MVFQVSIQRMNLMDYHVYNCTGHSLNLHKRQHQMPVNLPCYQPHLNQILHCTGKLFSDHIPTKYVIKM